MKRDFHHEHVAYELGVRPALVWEIQQRWNDATQQGRADIQQTNEEHAREYAGPGAYTDDWYTAVALHDAGLGDGGWAL